MIRLYSIDYDVRARDGTWCCLPYPGHPGGCPKFPGCIAEHPDFKDWEKSFRWWAVIEEFNLKAHAETRKLKYPGMSERQARNLLYWQGGVKSRLRKKALAARNPNGMILTVPEASGVNVFKTMERIGIRIEKNPQVVCKVMLVGNP